MEPINQLSPELTKIVNEARPKHGQVIYFESLRLKSGGTSVKSVDRIYDPFWENGDGTQGRYTDIGYVLGQLPAIGSVPARWNFGRIQFTRSADNIMPTSGNNRSDDNLFMYLFLTNYNKMNIGKKWYAPSDGQQPLFTQQKPEATAKEANDYRRKVRLAGEKIDNTPNSKLLDLALALDMKGINEFSNMEEIRHQLYLIAEGDPKKGIQGNPDRVLNMDKDTNLNMKLFIKEALKYKIWYEDRALRLFVWNETKEIVFPITPGQDLYAEGIKYLLGAGQKTFSLVKGLIDKEKEKEKKRKSYVDPLSLKDAKVSDVAVEALEAGDNDADKIIVNKEIVEVKE